MLIKVIIIVFFFAEKFVQTLPFQKYVTDLGAFLDTQTPQKHPSGHPPPPPKKKIVRNFLKWQSQAYN